MEDFSRPAAEEPETSPTESRSHRSTRESFLSTWFRRQQERLSLFDHAETTPEDNDDEETESKPTKKGFMKRWKSLFSRVVPPAERATEEQPEAVDHEGWQRDKAEPPLNTMIFERQFTTEQTPDEDIQPSVSTEEAAPVITSAIPETGEISREPASSEQTEEAADPLEVKKEPEAAKGEVVADLTLPKHVEPVEARSHTSEVPDTQYASPTAPGEVVRVERRGFGGAVAAFLGAEFLSRRRDRKIRRSVEHLKKESVRAAESHERLEQQMKQKLQETKPVPAPEAPKRPIEYALKQPIVEHDERPHPQPEKLSSILEKTKLPERREANPEQKAEKTPKPPEVAPPLPRQAVERIIERMPEARMVIEREEELEPAEVLHQVEEAAEKEVPIERLFERRHEVKDEPAHQPLAAGATPVTMATTPRTPQHTQTPAPQYPSPPQIPVSPQPLPQTEDPGMYRRAATNGFIAAIILVAILGIFALLS